MKLEIVFSILILLFGCTANQVVENATNKGNDTAQKVTIPDMNKTQQPVINTTKDNDTVGDKEDGTEPEEEGSEGIVENEEDGTNLEEQEVENNTMPSIDKLFSDNVKITLDQTYLFVESNGMPTHETGNFPNQDNPNSIQEQDFNFKFPLTPVLANTQTELPMGPIAIAFNGVVIYNPYNADGGDAVKLEVFDDCEGHPDPQGRYHYHQFSDCVSEEHEEHTPLGLAFDGFVIYGVDDGVGLDECNGHEDEERAYHYHTTTTLPYVIGCYSGIAEESNFDQVGGNPPQGQKPPPRDGPPPPR